MSEMKEDKSKSDISLKDYLTEEERRRLVASLHHALVWVGVKEPQELNVDKDDLSREIEKFHQKESDLPPEVHASGKIELHRLIWRLINEKEITEPERIQIEEIIEILQKKERSEEEDLKEEALSSEKARALHDEAAGIIRSILDLKDALKKKRHATAPVDVNEELIRQKVSQAKRWNQLIEEIKGDKS
ncbi:MAG TPA: DUF5788 family protein [Methanothrix sp.]|nr:DUF5788 family protein [Methanothrix sp.]